MFPPHGLGCLRPEELGVARRPSFWDSAVSQTRVLIWYNEG
jgi:hypothetical protein